jgi:AcrR family transcriptional regulator
MRSEVTDAGVNDRVAVPPPRDRSRRRGRDAGDTQSVARTQILDAAVACILELGFYRASTNEIARRANVSWGSIQYHFGSREALLLAVIEELNQRFTTTVNQAEISGDTLEERLESLYTILAQHYAAPTYLARLQILLNLSHDPDTSAGVAAALERLAEVAGSGIRRLLRSALGNETNDATINVVFHAVRGTALSHQITDAVPWDPAASHTSTIDHRELAILVAGLAAAARQDLGADMASD